MSKSGSLFQLCARPGLQSGDLVYVWGRHMPSDPYGRVLKVEQEDYKLPNPCMVSHTGGRVDLAKLTLYLIRGIDEPWDYTTAQPTISWTA